VKVAGTENSVVHRFHRLNAVRRRATVRDQVFSQVLDGAYSNTTQIGTGLMLLLAAQAMRTHRFTVGDFALFVSYLEWLTAIPLYLGRLLSGTATVAVSFDRMEELMHDAPTGALVQAASVPTLRRPVAAGSAGAERLRKLTVTNLTYHYPGASQGIDGINFEVQQGEFVVIIGRMAAGKSTLLRVLLGLLPHQAGEVRWNGDLIDDLDQFMIPPRGAYTSQAPQLFSGTLRENILLGLPETMVDIDAALHLAAMEPDVSSMAKGLDTEVGRRGVQLSGGQTQRTAVARMLVRTPDLLVVDDVSSALDVHTEHILWQKLLNIGQRTVIAVSHRRPILERADRVIVLHSGKVAATGRLAEVLKESWEARAMWDAAL